MVRGPTPVTPVVATVVAYLSEVTSLLPPPKKKSKCIFFDAPLLVTVIPQFGDKPKYEIIILGPPVVPVLAPFLGRVPQKRKKKKQNIGYQLILTSQIWRTL